jgi:DNA-binding GntR family transcriptional regulator
LLLQEKAYEIIKKRILTNTYKTGEMLSENGLVEDLGMSRSPIRNALVRLSKEGFVQIVPQKGAIVNDMSAEEVRDIFDLRIAVEAHAAQRLPNRLNSKDVEALQTLLVEQRKIAEKGNVTDFVTLDFSFHLYLLKKYGNTKMVAILENLRDRMIQCGIYAARDQQRMRQTIEEHEAILHALINGTDSPSAQLLMETHLNNGKNRFFEQ